MQRIPTVSRRIHPAVAGAALTAAVVGIVAAAALAGWLPALLRHLR